MAARRVPTIPCKFFAAGRCDMGSRCKFSHDLSTAAPLREKSEVCVFFLRKQCRNGDRCPYLHETPGSKRAATKKPAARMLVPMPMESRPKPVESAAVVAAPPPPAPTDVSSGRLFANIVAPEGPPPEGIAALRGEDDDVGPFLCGDHIDGACDNPDCQLVHGDVCEGCGRSVLFPSGMADEANAEHRRQCEHERLHAAELAASATLECGVCLERPLERRERFGLLIGCDHIFCLSCIRNWRSKNDSGADKSAIRSCPLCRAPSHYIVPCDRFVASSPRKDEVIASYKAHLQTIPCRNFIYEKVSCPFGASCFYAHLKPDGTPVEYVAPRKYMGQSGIVEPIKEHHLADFLFRGENMALVIDALETFYYSDSD